MLNGRSILVVVPARGGSKGIPLKNLREINGVPLVGLAGLVVRELMFVDRAIVSTDHPRIAEVARAYGLDVPFLRPPSLSGDRVSDWEVLSHALVETERADERRYDVVVMLQPTSPSRKPRHVADAVRKLVEGEYDAVWTVSETDSKSHPLKQLVLSGDRLDYYDPRGAAIVARQQLEPVYHRNGIAYAVTRECIVDQGTIMGARTSALVVPEAVANIDTELDLELAALLIARSGR